MALWRLLAIFVPLSRHYLNPRPDLPKWNRSWASLCRSPRIISTADG